MKQIENTQLPQDPMEGIARMIDMMAREEFGDVQHDEYVATLKAKIITLEARVKHLEDLVKNHS